MGKLNETIEKVQVKNKIKPFLLSHIEDFLILGAIILIIVTTFLITVVAWNIIAGMYVTAAFMLLLGVYFAFNPVNRKVE